MIADYKEILNKLPKKPGIYIYYKALTIIYVGKAKNLKNRVSSYFLKTHKSLKTKLLVQEADKLEFIVLNSEVDAFHLENTYIKKHKPKFNILLKDSKTYPYIAISKEEFPRFFMTRKVEPVKNIYYGPYVSARMIKFLLNMFQEVFKIRDCSLDLSSKNIDNHKFKVCLKYHIKRCKGVCEGLQAKDEYLQNIEHVKNILKGNFSIVHNILKEERDNYSEKLEFEKAAEIQERINLLNNYSEKSIVVNPNIGDLDAFNYFAVDSKIYVCYLQLIKGTITMSYIIELKNNGDEDLSKVLTTAIFELRSKFDSKTKDIIVPFDIEEIPNSNISVPQIGDKKKILDLALKNLEQYKQLFAKPEKVYGYYDKMLLKAKNDLRLKAVPVHIECFDNSNIQGTSPVASCIVFKNGRPSKSDYRHFNVKTVIGADDFATMEEIIYRRYSRILAEESTLPNLIVIDGGKGQLHSALNSLEKLDLIGKIEIISIAKKLEEIFIPDDNIPLYIDKTSTTLKLIQQLRDEAHRFGIKFHRVKRDSKMLVSQLDAIVGIGEKTKDTLLKHFGTIENIKMAKEEDIMKLIGKTKAILLFNNFKKN